jgi:hypothetical protein
VNAIGPDYFRADLTEVFYQDPTWCAAMLEKIPAGGFGALEDLVGATVFLWSNAARYVTGQLLCIATALRAMASAAWRAFCSHRHGTCRVCQLCMAPKSPCRSPKCLWRLAEGSDEGAPHAFLIAEADTGSYAVDRIGRTLDAFARSLDA